MLKTIVTTREAAQMMGITTQAVYVALRNKSLKSEKLNNRIVINVEDVKKYRSQRYDRAKSKNEDGSLVYNPDLGLFSVQNLAQIFGVTQQRIYYLISRKKLDFYRRGSAYVIPVIDLTSTMKLVRENLRDSKEVEIKEQ